MRPAIRNASARQHSGGLSPVTGRGQPNERARKPGRSEIEAEIAGLLDRPTPELRHAWREFHRAGPPLGLSRDLLIRALAYELQEHAHGGPSLALRRRLQSLAGALENGAVDPGLVLYGRAVVILGASGGSAFGALVPALSALFAVPLVGEWPNRTDWLGIMLISAGV